MSRATPRRLAAPRHRLALTLDGGIVEERVAGVAIPDLGNGRQLVGRDVDALGDGRRVPLELLGFAPRHPRLLLAQLAVERPRGERPVRDQLGARLACDA